MYILECWPCTDLDILINKYFPVGALQQGLYCTMPIQWNIIFSPASPGRSRVGPELTYLATWVETKDPL
jgi:hypothetical protein